MIGIDVSTATAASQSSFVQALFAKRTFAATSAGGSAAIAACCMATSTSVTRSKPDVDHRRRPCRDADRHAGRDNRVNATGGLALAKFSISGRVHFDPAIDRRHF